MTFRIQVECLGFSVERIWGFKGSGGKRTINRAWGGQDSGIRHSSLKDLQPPPCKVSRALSEGAKYLQIRASGTLDPFTVQYLGVTNPKPTIPTPES